MAGGVLQAGHAHSAGCGAWRKHARTKAQAQEVARTVNQGSES
jgi:hypothetical protein